MSLDIELDQAVGRLAELISEASAGTDVVILRNGRPIARLVSAGWPDVADRVPGSARGLFTVPDDFDAPLEDFPRADSA